MRLAFVMGSNGPAHLGPLQYAQQDAQKIKACLSGPKCGFEVFEPKPECTAFELRQSLYDATELCNPGDTFICYFSGHGILEKGALILLWHHTELGRLSTALPIVEIMQALKHCKAQNKFLILDCCHAGAVVQMVGLKDIAGVPVTALEIQPDNFLVLMASDRLEKAQELESLQGSFLTSTICAALGKEFEVADHDGDGRLSTQDLRLWLESRAREHNQNFPSTAVPFPFLYNGSRSAPFNGRRCCSKSHT